MFRLYIMNPEFNPDSFEFNANDFESPVSESPVSELPRKRKRNKSPSIKNKKSMKLYNLSPKNRNKSMKRKKSGMEYYNNNDIVYNDNDTVYDVNDTVFKKMLENIEDPGLPDEYDTFHAEMEQLYKTLERNDNAKELTEIIKELTERINKKIKTEKENIKESTNKFHIQYRNDTIKRYQNNLNKLNKLDDIQKSDILEIYNNPDIHKDDKRNAINAIINGDKVITAKPRELNSMHISSPISMANSADKSSSTRKIKKIKKTSGGKKSTKKSRTKKTRK
jgi:hypothetical protein